MHDGAAPPAHPHDQPHTHTLSGLQACADECAATVGCEAFDYGHGDISRPYIATPAEIADRKGMCWFEHTTTAPQKYCAEVHSMKT